MELRHLRYFEAVAAELSFTRAAERLGVSQPGLSHQIRQLEQELGAPLFDRIGRRIQLTPVGRAFARHARDALRAIERAKSEAAEMVEMTGGVLRVGAIQSVNAYLIPPTAAAFRAEAPMMRLQICEHKPHAIEAMLLAGDLDVGVAFAPPEADGLSAETLFEEPLVGVVDRARSERWPGEIGLGALADRPLALLSDRMQTRRILDSAFAEVGAEPQPAIEANSIESLLRTVLGTDLCAVLPSRAVIGRHEVRALRLVDPTPRRTLALLRENGAHRTRSALAFERLLRAQIAVPDTAFDHAEPA